MTLVVAALILLTLFLVMAGHLNAEVIRTRWDMTLNPEGLRVYSAVCDELAFGRRVAQKSYDDAASANANGELAEALRLLDVGARIVSDCSGDVLALLRGIANIARHAEALAPMPPLFPQGFHARRLTTLTGAHTALHYLLVGTRERLAWRIAVLRLGVRTSTDMVVRSTFRLKCLPGDPWRWRHVDAMRGDLGKLTDESLETLRTVLASLAAVRRPAEATEQKTA